MTSIFEKNQSRVQIKDNKKIDKKTVEKIKSLNLDFCGFDMSWIAEKQKGIAIFLVQYSVLIIIRIILFLVIQKMIIIIAFMLNQKLKKEAKLAH